MFEKYDAYKDSGVDWIDTVPTNWQIKKAFLYFDATKGKNAALLTKEYCGLNEGIYPVYSGQTENHGIMGKISNFEFDFSKHGCLFSTTVGAKAMTLRFLKHQFSLSQNCMIITNRKLGEIYTKFYYYALQPMFEYYRNLIPDHMQASFRMEDFFQYKFLLPTYLEQRKITDFLDQKAFEIDQAIAIKEQQIALLNERKQIVIQKAVTQGLDPNVLMKDSGLNGVGNIPQDWEIIKFKYLAKVRYGLGQPPRQLDNGLKIIRATNIERGKIVEKGMLYIDPNDIPWDRNPTLNKDEIIVVRSGAYTGDSAIVTEEYAGCIAGYDMVATPFNCYPKFLSTVLLSHYVLYEQIYLLRMRSAQPHLNAEELNELKIVVPPINQQRLIANYIEKVESDIGEAISLIKQQLEKLKEYKTTLINDAVTGKIKVA